MTTTNKLHDIVRLTALAGVAALLGCPGPTNPGPKNPNLPQPEPVLPDTSEGDTAEPATQVPRTEPPIQELAFPAEEFRATQPGESSPRAFQLPKMSTFKLKSGIQVYLLERHELPTISVELNFDGGLRVDPDGKRGMASVCMDMLAEGTEKLDKIAFREALADIASDVGSYAATDTQGIWMRTLSKHWDATYALFADTVLSPGLRAEDFDRMIKRRLEGLKQAKAAPASIAGRLADAVLYGADHPYGQITTEETLGALQIEDCAAFHDKWIKPRGARLFVVGDMTAAQVRAAFDGKTAPLAGWKGAMPRMGRMGKPKPLAGKVFFVHVPDAAQSAIAVMHMGPQRKARDYFATTLASGVLGGNFNSRVNMNLREDKGYSYGAGGGFRYNRDYGEMVLRSSVRSNTTYQSVLEMYNELAAIASGKNPPTVEEITREKNGAILGLPGRFATARQALGQYRELVYHRLPLDYFNTYVKRVQAVKRGQVLASAKRHFKPRNAIILVVGDAHAPVIRREGDSDVAFEKDGKPVTLIDALRDLLASGAVGRGELVLLDADAQVVQELPAAPTN